MSTEQKPTSPTPEQVEEIVDEVMRIPAKQPPAFRQIKLRPRHFPPAPGLVPLPVDIIIIMTIQFALVITNFLVILTSFAYDGNDLGWIIFFQILFTYIGFAYFVRKLSDHKFIFEKFFKGITLWHDRKLEEISNGNSSCAGCWCLFVRLIWWIVALIEFPFIICWSMWQSYKWYQDRRNNAQSTVDLMDMKNCTSSIKDAKQYWKRHDRAYSVWHLGVLAKQAALIVMFIQDIPLLVMAFYIVNYLGIVVYLICIILKLVFWIKHMYDVGSFTLYKAEDYLDHFGIKSISWERDEFGCHSLSADFYTEWMREMGTLQIGDWVKVYNEVNQEYKVMIVWKIRHFKRSENLVLVEYDKVDRKAIDDFEKGNTKKIMIEPKEDDIHYMSSLSWFVADGELCGNIELLRDEEYTQYHDCDTQTGDDDVDDTKEEEEAVQVMLTKETVIIGVIDMEDTHSEEEGNKNKTKKEYQAVSMNDEDEDEDSQIR